MHLGSNAYEGLFSFASRFEPGAGTNPEKLLDAAQAGCFTMLLSALLGKEGFAPDHIRTNAKVHLSEGPTITSIELECEASVPGISEERFQQLAEKARTGC